MHDPASPSPGSVALARCFLVLALLPACGERAPTDAAVIGDLAREEDLASGPTADLSALPADGGLETGLDGGVADLTTIPADLAGVDLVASDPCAGPSAGGLQLLATSALPFGEHLLSIPSFAMTAVTPSSATTLTVILSDAAVPSEAQAVATWAITPPLAVTGVVASGAVVSLTTAAQVPGQAYTLAATNLHAAVDGALLAGARTFAGHRFGIKNVVGASDYLEPKTVLVYFNDSVACTELTNATRYEVSSRTVVAAQAPGCGARASYVTLRLDRALQPGKHILSVAPALTDTKGASVSPLHAVFDGPGVPAALYVQTLAVSATQVMLDFNDDVDATSATSLAGYALSPTASITAATFAAPNRVTLTVATDANVLYTLSVGGVLAAGASAVTAIPPRSFLGGGSFHAMNGFSSKPHQAVVTYALPPSASGADPTKYVIDGGAMVSAVSLPGGGATVATLTLVADVRGASYTLHTDQVASPTLAMYTGFRGEVELAVSADIDLANPPAVFFAGENLTVSHGLGFGSDARHLRFTTGLRPSGVYQLKVCGLVDQAHTARLATADIPFVVP